MRSYPNLSRVTLGLSAFKLLPLRVLSGLWRVPVVTGRHCRLREFIELKFPASVQIFWGASSDHFSSSMRLFKRSRRDPCLRPKGSRVLAKAQGSDRRAEEDASASGSCSAASDQTRKFLMRHVLTACAYRWFGPRWRRGVSVCQKSVGRPTKTAPRGRGPVTGISAQPWFVLRCLSGVRFLTYPFPPLHFPASTCFCYVDALCLTGPVSPQEQADRPRP